MSVLRWLPVATALLCLAVAAPSGAVTFQTPSRNIACGMFDDPSAGGAFVRCDIREHSWALPAKPSHAGCRELDFEGDLEVTAKGRGHFICAGDTILGSGRTLPYGHARRVGRFTCTSRTSGVTCRNRRTRHGFFVSRGSYRRF